MADTEGFKAFLNRLRSLGPDAFPDKVELETAIYKFACEGCGKHCKPCRACEECSVFAANEDVAYCEMRCEDCFFCGCPKCAKGWEYDGYMESPYSEWRVKSNARKEAAFDVACEVGVPPEKLINIFGAELVKKKFPYTSNKELWRTHFLIEGKKEECPAGVKYDDLREMEKRFFEISMNSHAHTLYAKNYKVLRAWAAFIER